MLPNSEPYLTSMIERFGKVVKGFYPFIIFAKCSNLDVWQGSKYVSGPCLDSSIRTVYVCMYLHMNNEYHSLYIHTQDEKRQKKREGFLQFQNISSDLFHKTCHNSRTEYGTNMKHGPEKLVSWRKSIVT